MKTCNQCAAYHEIKNGIGQCRANAPIPQCIGYHAEPPGFDEIREGYVSSPAWPQVCCDDWCLGFVPKDEIHEQP
jgi:hypothetical protein